MVVHPTHPFATHGTLIIGYTIAYNDILIIKKTRFICNCYTWFNSARNRSLVDGRVTS